MSPLGAMRWALFPASTRQLWFISDYLLLLLCVPLLNRLLHGLPRAAHRGVLAVLVVPLLVYPTLFAENGLTVDTAWMFLYEYLLIAHLRRYPDNRLTGFCRPLRCAAPRAGAALVNTAVRAVLEMRGLTDGKAFPVHCLLPHRTGRTAQPAGRTGAVLSVQKGCP